MALLLAEEAGPLEKVSHFVRSISGAEVNVAIGLQRLGHQTEYMTRLGDDPFGHYIKNALEEVSIGTRMITFDKKHQTGIQLKELVLDGKDPKAPYYRKHSAASYLSVEDIGKIDLSEIALLHVTGIPPALSESVRCAVVELMKRAKAQGIFVTFDPNLRPALWESNVLMKKILNQMAVYADLVLPGIKECKILLGTEDAKEAAKCYHEFGVTGVVIKLGEKGAYISKKEENQIKAEFVPGFKVDKVVDTVGAGDGFAAGILHGLLEGKTLGECAVYGNAIGALQVTCRGDNEGLPSKEKLKSIVESGIV